MHSIHIHRLAILFRATLGTIYPCIVLLVHARMYWTVKKVPGVFLMVERCARVSTVQFRRTYISEPSVYIALALTVYSADLDGWRFAQRAHAVRTHLSRLRPRRRNHLSFCTATLRFESKSEALQNFPNRPIHSDGFSRDCVDLYGLSYFSLASLFLFHIFGRVSISLTLIGWLLIVGRYHSLP